MLQSACRCRQTPKAMAGLSAWESVHGSAMLALRATLLWAGIPPTCTGKSVSVLPNKLPFCKTAQLPKNHTWPWLKYQECDSVSGICCLHAVLQLCFHGRWHQQHSSRPAYNILKARQKVINSKYSLNLITQLVYAFTFALTGIKPSSFSSS